eukprot:scpid68206/ scgid31273/ Hemicentin-1; Fibulin-6
MLMVKTVCVQVLLVWTILNVVTAQDSAVCSILSDGTDLSAAFSISTVAGQPTANNDSDVIQRPGQQFTFICLVTVPGSGSTAPTFQWSWNSSAVVPATATACSSSITNYSLTVATGSMDQWNVSLVLCAAMRTNAGAYSLRRTGASATVQTLTLYAPIEFSTAPGNTDIDKGKSVTLRCVASGYPRPSIDWRRGGQSVANLDSRFSVSSSELAGSPLRTVEATFTLTDAQYKDRSDGTFSCEASNRRTAGDLSSESRSGIIVRVRDPLGALWPTLGIVVQAVILTVVLFCDQKVKQAAKLAGGVAMSGSEVDLDVILGRKDNIMSDERQQAESTAMTIDSAP